MPEVPWRCAHAVARSVEDEAAVLGLPVLDATCPPVSKVHSQGERYVQQGRSVVVTGHAGAKNSSNSNWLREIGAEAKIPAFLIADKMELGLDVLRSAKAIGLTAGASAHGTQPGRIEQRCLGARKI